MSQKVLVAGTGISGIAAAKLLLAQGGEVVLYDGNEKLSAEELKKNFDEGAKVSVILGELKKLDLSGVELCVISPGISLEAPFVAVLDEARVPIWSEIELAYHCSQGKLIAITGTNGIGKTTLLKSILGLIPSLSGSCELGENLQIGYFEQEVRGDNRTTCIEELWQDFPSYTQYEIRSALAKCGLTTKHIESQVRVLSGGEQAKVRLCKLINRDTNVLLLDEPTNHLDVDAKDALKSALKEYKGSILLICHEPEFYQDVVNEVWDMSRWTTKIF